MELTWVVLGVVTIVAVTSLAPRVGVAAPLILLGIGIGVGLLPFVPVVHIEPEWILAGVLPPLLYSSAINIPTTDFRRDLRAISALSLLLVVVSAVAVGWVMARLIPGIGFAEGIVLGAIISPTDAVATALVKRAGVSRRIVTVLEGESMLNDASALVLLKSAVAAISASVSLWDVSLRFVWAVLAAVVIGWLVGELNLVARSHLADSPSSVAISAAAPFAAYLPAEHFHASGLVAAVAAGLVTGHGSLAKLSARDRLAERAVWQTLAVVLEGAVFLTMGLQLYGLIRDSRAGRDATSDALLYGVVASALVIVLRFGFVATFITWLGRRGRRSEHWRERLTNAQELIADPDWLAGRPDSPRAQRRTQSFVKRVTQAVADLDYFAAERFGWREITVLTWAGTRGAVTLAAAQSLDRDVPQRSLLVLVAFVVAAGSLTVQGFSLPWLVRWLDVGGRDGNDESQRRELEADLSRVIVRALDDGTVTRSDGEPLPVDQITRLRGMYEAQADEERAERVQDIAEQLTSVRLQLVRLRRERIAQLRDLGVVASGLLAEELDELDAEELALTTRSGD